MGTRARAWRAVGGLAVFAVAAFLGFATGRVEGARTEAVSASFAQAPGLQELVPLPGPGRQFPGPQPQPGQGNQECEAKVYLFYNGRFYEMRPGPGWDRNGLPTGPQEFYPLQPVPGAPGLPAPGPNPFTPRLPGPGQRF